MAPGTQSNQIFLGIISKAAALIEVVDVKIRHQAAVLAAPAIPLQHLLAQLTIGFWVEPEAGPAREHASHEAFLSCSKNCFCCGGGRN